MQQEVTSQLDSLVRLYVLPIAWKLAGALVIWLGGRFGIGVVRTALRRTL